jgi:hypothetical protein
LTSVGAVTGAALADSPGALNSPFRVLGRVLVTTATMRLYGVVVAAVRHLIKHVLLVRAPIQIRQIIVVAIVISMACF